MVSARYLKHLLFCILIGDVTNDSFCFYRFTSDFEGLSYESSIGFAFFGSLLVKCGNIKNGCKFVMIARQLMDKPDSKEFVCEIMSVY